MKGALELIPEGDQIRIDWTISGDAGDNPTYKITAKMMKPYMSKDLRAGLVRLKGIVGNWE